jgi:hypothetical protein
MDMFPIEWVADYGFAGFSLILLGVIVWLVKKILGVIEHNNTVIASNTKAMQMLLHEISNLRTEFSKHEETLSQLRDKVISRPCIATREE